MDGDEPQKYRQIVRLAAEQPWAILPGTLAVILDVLAIRAAGGRLSDEEISERVGARPQRPPAANTGTIVMLPLYGVIIPRASLFSDMSGGTSVAGFTEMFRAAVNDPDVKGIVIDVDSPGGLTDMIPEAAAEMRAARGSKPIVAVANTLAASAAYWLASQADEVVVSPSGLAGSIGVIAAHDDLTAMQERMGVKTTLITAGRYKAEESPFQPLSEEAEAAIQQRVDDMYGLFVADVAAGRGVDEQAVREGYGEGRVLTARAAVRAGLVDRVETLDATIARMKRNAQESTRGRRSEAGEINIVSIAVNDAPAGSGVPIAASSSSVSFTSGMRDYSTVSDGRRVAPLAVGTAGDSSTSASLEDGGSSRAPVRPEPSGNRKPDTEGRGMTIDELVQRNIAIGGRIREIHASYHGTLLPEALQEEWNQLKEERLANEAIIKDDAERRALVDQFSNVEGAVERPTSGRDRTVYRNRPKVPAAVWDIAAYMRENDHEQVTGAYVEGASRAIEMVAFAHPEADRDKALAHIHRLLGTVDSEHGTLARHILATGSPAYRRAFGKTVQGKPLSQEEMDAMRTVAALTTGPGSSAGLAVPVTLDPTVVPTSNYTVNPIRRLASVTTITTNDWKGVTAGAVTAHYRAEGTEVSDDTPTLAQPEIIPERVDAFIPFSIEAGQDWGALESEMAVLIQDGKDVVEATKFVHGAGHGSNEPEGLLVGGTVVVLTAGTAAFVRGDLDLLEAALPPRFVPRATIIGAKPTFQKVRSFAAAGDQSAWNRLDAGLPPQLVGYPGYEASDYISTYTVSGSSVLTIGDFSYYKIIDRIGMSIEVVPHLMGSNRRPTGQRGLLAFWRNSAGVISANAFRTLKVR